MQGVQLPLPFANTLNMAYKPTPQIKLRLEFKGENSKGEVITKKKTFKVNLAFIYSLNSHALADIKGILEDLNELPNVEVNFNCEGYEARNILWSIQQLLKVIDKREGELKVLPTLKEKFQLYKKGIHFKY